MDDQTKNSLLTKISGGQADGGSALASADAPKGPLKVKYSEAELAAAKQHFEEMGAKMPENAQVLHG